MIHLPIHKQLSLFSTFLFPINEIRKLTWLRFQVFQKSCTWFVMFYMDSKGSSDPAPTWHQKVSPKDGAEEKRHAQFARTCQPTICPHTCTGVYVPLLALHIYAICIPIFTNICIYVCIMYVSLMFSLQRGKEKWVQGKLVHQNKNGQMQSREPKKVWLNNYTLPIFLCCIQINYP